MSRLISAGQSYCLLLWEGDTKQGPILQAIHMAWTIGATIGPILASPFLVEINQEIQIQTTIVPDQAARNMNMSSGYEATTQRVMANLCHLRP